MRRSTSTAQSGKRAIPFDDFHRLPENTPHIETALQPDELITVVELPAASVREELALSKSARPSELCFRSGQRRRGAGSRRRRDAECRLALGGVAHKPWRAFASRKGFGGRGSTAETFRRAAEAELADARGFAHNDFKIELAKRTIVSVLSELAEQGGAR